MAFKYSIDARKRRVVATVEGEVTTDAIIETISAVARDPLFKSGFDVVSDHTQITNIITTEMVKNTVELLHDLSEQLVGVRWAVITSADASYGMMRMLSVYAERVPLDMQVFRSAEEAEQWLSSKTPLSTN